MLFKTILQFLIVLLISIILGGVYYHYFLKTADIEENIDNSVEKKIDNVDEKIIDFEKKEIEVVEKEVVEKEVVEKEVVEKEVVEKNNNNLISKETPSYSKDVVKEKKTENVKSNKKSSESLGNTLTEVEYLTTDKKGNKYKIFAKSAVTNKQDRSMLELNEVKGIISSAKRSNIYIVSDFAKYNSSNQNSNFYQNVVINFEEKQIDCDFFDIDMQTNLAIAYGNVIVTDPKSIMKAGKITLDIQTKDINIEPEVKKKINIETE